MLICTCLEEAAHSCPTLSRENIWISQKVARHYCKDISKSKEHRQVVEEEVELLQRLGHFGSDLKMSNLREEYFQFHLLKLTYIIHTEPLG